MRFGGWVIASTVVMGWAATATADATTCAAASERGQRARAADKLGDARTEFLACSASNCPPVIAKDCAGWAGDVLAAMPSVVIDAKDESGQDLSDGQVTIDGRAVASQVDGKAIAVDPGVHDVAVTHDGVTQTEHLIAKEGEKSRLVHFVFPSPSPPHASEAAPPTQPSQTNVGPWLLAGAGVLSVGVGVAVVLTSPRLPANCNADTEKCSATPGESSAAVEKDRDQAGRSAHQVTYGVVTIVGGALLVAGGALWYLLDARKPRSAMIAPWLLPGSGGLAATGVF